MKRFEKIPVEIFHSSEDASVSVAREIAQLIKEKAKSGKMAVLGLATGSTPTRIYEELVRMHQEEELSFSNVITFNLDEYYPIKPESLQSYVKFMNEYLFDHIDIKAENINIPDGTIEPDDIGAYCRMYEEKIEAVGGIDLQLLGVGRTGHIGFNEPGSSKDSKTRLIILDKITRTDAASDFFGVENVPVRAITMGVGTILKAKKIILLAWGEGKSAIIKRTTEGDITESIPATYLQLHPNIQIVLDDASASELTRVKTPWLTGQCDWDEALERKAVIWLARKLKKAILKLTDEDYNEHGMSALNAEHGGAYKINIRVFEHLKHTVTGWPGGKPGDDDKARPGNVGPFPKKVLIFSPHPDDDVISMGGTLLRLVDQGHDVNVAYQTSGNIAVFDDDAIKFTGFVKDFNNIFGLKDTKTEVIYNEMMDFLENKEPGTVDTSHIQQIKGLIRRGEALSACRYCGIKQENVFFQDLPFYETGKVRKNPLGEKDIQLTVDLLQKVQPNQIYVAGDLSDPHGTHRVCLKAVFEALERVRNEEWIENCQVWMYRGAWQEWDIDQIEMAVPLSPDELERKKKAIFKHQSQKDRPLFPGADQREFWQRAEERNKTTAKIYDLIGLAEYEAIEAFVQYKL